MKFKELISIYKPDVLKTKFKSANIFIKILVILIAPVLGLLAFLIFSPILITVGLWKLLKWVCIRLVTIRREKEQQRIEQEQQQIEQERQRIEQERKQKEFEEENARKLKEQQELYERARIEREKKLKEEQEMYNIKNYKVAGIIYHMDAVMELAIENDMYDISKKELIESYEELCESSDIYEYEFYVTDTQLIPEPDNPHDPNAIKVVADDQHIGYIKAGSCRHLLKVINEGRLGPIECRIYGGPYKYLDLDFDETTGEEIYTVINEEGDFKAKLTIKEKKK